MKHSTTKIINLTALKGLAGSTSNSNLEMMGPVRVVSWRKSLNRMWRRIRFLNSPLITESNGMILFSRRATTNTKAIYRRTVLFTLKWRLPIFVIPTTPPDMTNNWGKGYKACESAPVIETQWIGELRCSGYSLLQHKTVITDVATTGQFGQFL